MIHNLILLNQIITLFVGRLHATNVRSLILRLYATNVHKVVKQSVELK